MSVEIKKAARPVVLVVDDDDTTRMLAKRSLEMAGFQLVEAEDGLAAMKALERGLPDIILLDVEMPHLDGFETCVQVRALPGGVTLPILMVTSFEDATSIDRAYAAGATDFTTKPINWSLLQHRIRYLLRASETLKNLTSTTQDLTISQARLDNAQRIARLGNWEWDPANDWMWWSDEVYRILEIQPGEVTSSPAAWLMRVHPEDREAVRIWFADAKQRTASTYVTHRILLPSGSECYVQHQSSPSNVDDSRTGLVYGTVQDVTQRVHAENKVRKLAYFDSLTHLANRESFSERLAMEVARAKRHGWRLGVLFLDVDDFKRINDTLGHSVGDLLLKGVAERITDCVRISDTMAHINFHSKSHQVARLGGDEFTILLVDLQHGEDAAMVASRVQDKLTSPFTLSGNEIYITPSIGIAVYPEDGEDAEILVKNADTAMYYAKRAGKNRYQFYDESMNAAALRRLTLDGQMRRALERGEFVVHYQPQMDLTSESIDAAEALLRWHNPELGNISPLEFIPLAEENGMIIPIGEWVIRTACAQAKVWRDEGFCIRRIAVNVSIAQFVRSNFAGIIRQALADAELEPDGLELEVTESLLAKNVESSVRILNELKQIGVQLSIDDFGTGYSSMSHLKNFPVDRLKIDRSFVKGVTTDPDDKAITMAVLSMAKSMHMGVVAEGVENVEQLEFFKTRLCEQVQGYYLSRPVPPEELVDLVKQFTGSKKPQRV